jgi:NAD+ synthase (glutamine-hydrolysing)
MSVIRIAQAQINPTVGDLAGNAAMMADWIGKARDAAVDIVTFPELSLCGYPPEDLLLKPRFQRDTRKVLDSLLQHTHGITAVIGFPHQENNRVYNSAALIHNGNLIDIYSKIELPNYGVFDEKRYFHPGCDCAVFEMAGIRFSLTICEDIWIPESLCETCVSRNQAEIVLNISASPYSAGKQVLRRNIVARFAQASGATVFYNNLVGGQDELVFDGGALVVSPTGEVLASGPRFEECLFLTDYQQTGPGRKQDGWKQIAPVYILQCPERSDRPILPPEIVPEYERSEEIYKALVLGTGDYVRKNGFSKVVMGLSGGIDSALTAAIAVEALGKERVIGVTMPSQYTSGETFSDAELLARNLGIRLITIPVRDIFQSYLGALAEYFSTGSPGVESENLQARIRGNLLMALSNRFGWLVLTTGNKSETAVGYCTLYGDMAGGFAVIKDVPKTVVYELTRYANRNAGRELIPRSIIDRAPSAELRPDQKDEDSLPPYAVLDPILTAYVEEDRAPDEIEGFAADVVKEVVRMVDCNEYKRRQAPPGVKITPKAFGRDRRLPITNRYQKHT